MRSFLARALAPALLLLAQAVPAGADGLDQLRKELDRLGPGRWLELTGNAAGTIKGTAISRVFPARTGHPAWGIVGPRSVVVAWCGAAYDTKRDQLFVFGGGHMDYGGNEVYLFDMARREWMRVTHPSAYDDKFNTVDGTPVSRHTYDGIEYLPGPDRMFVTGGSVYSHNGWATNTTWTFDSDFWRWTRLQNAPIKTHPASAYDPVTGLIYVASVTVLYSYDPARSLWRQASQHAAWIPNGTAAFDPVRRYYVELMGHGLHYYDFSGASHGLAARRRAPVAGDTEVEKMLRPGLDFDPKRRVLFAWAGGRAVWSLDTGSFRFTKHANTAGPAPRQEELSRGIYGRWRYVPRLDAFVGFNDHDGNVWLYRPPMVNAGN